MEINKQHVALVEEFWKHLGNNDLDSALGLWTDDARWGSVANSDTVSKIGLMYCQGQLR
jgi:hypothetical protein